MSKELYKVTMLNKIENIVEIDGNHPNKNPNRGFIYINKDMYEFEEAFDRIFDIPELEFEDYCLISSNCEITLPSGKKFCGVSFKSSDDKEIIFRVLKRSLNNQGLIYADIDNNFLTLSTGEKVDLADCLAMNYELTKKRK